MNYGKLTAGTTKTAIDTAKPSEKGEIITYLARMGDVLEQRLAHAFPLGAFRRTVYHALNTVISRCGFGCVSTL